MTSRARGGDLSVTVACEAARATVTARGELDLSTAPLLQAVLDPLLNRRRVPAVDLLEIDASALTFADAAGLSPVLHARAVLAARGGRLAIRAPSRAVARVLTAFGLEPTPEGSPPCPKAS